MNNFAEMNSTTIEEMDPELLAVIDSYLDESDFENEEAGDARFAPSESTEGTLYYTADGQPFRFDELNWEDEDLAALPELEFDESNDSVSLADFMEETNEENGSEYEEENHHDFFDDFDLSALSPATKSSLFYALGVDESDIKSLTIHVTFR